MARFITVQVGCDWDGCTEIAPENEGTIVAKTISVDGKQTREFQLCKPHQDQLDEILLPLLQNGVKVEAPKKAPAKRSATRTSDEPVTPAGTSDSLVCKVDVGGRRCDRKLHNRTGMAQHVIRTHGYTDLAAYELEFGTVETHDDTTD